MGYQNNNTGRRYARRRLGGTGAAVGTVPRVGQVTASSEGAARGRDLETATPETGRRGGDGLVSAPTFMAAAVLLAIDAFLNKRDAVSFDGKEAA